MKNHEELRELLPLAAAGELSNADADTVRFHAEGCAQCAEELALMKQIVPGLANLPVPPAPAYLAQRTVLLVKRKRREAEERRWNNRMLGFLVAFSWVLSAISWPVVHWANGIGMWPWIGFSVLFSWVTAGCAVVILGSRAGESGRKHESLS